MKRVLPVLFLAALVSLGGGLLRLAARPVSLPQVANEQLGPAASSYVLLAWSELGMHCIDGKDYSTFSVLPPYNIVHSQLVQKGEPPVLVTSGATIVYQSTPDTNKSVN